MQMVSLAGLNQYMYSRTTLDAATFNSFQTCALLHCLLQ